MTTATQSAISILSQRRILVVEDEMMLMMMLEDILAELGCAVVPAGRVAKALTLAANEELDGAILDVNVAGERVYPVAEVLNRRGIPFVFSTGYGGETLPVEYSNRPLLGKPYLAEHVERALTTALTRAA